jgi:oxygen-independent coproporphyrinogen-3 oxidase
MHRPTSTRDLGVYIHVPFCERVCPYCDFAVEAAGSLDSDLGRDLGREYVDLLMRELDIACAADALGVAGRPLTSVYLGGGTPSLLQGAEIARLLESLGAHFAGPPVEVTLEANPGPLEIARLPEWRSAGVTRISLGVQSLQDHTLKGLGRAQSAAEARRGLDAVLAAGFESLSADLIYGAPQQAPGELFADLDQLIAAGVPHISTYALTLEPGTPFARAHAAGRLALPDEDTLLVMLRGLRARLAAAGFEHYEISSHARPGQRSRHNQRYWARRDVLGLGVGAASLLGERRLQNPRTRLAWGQALKAGRLPAESCELLSPRETRQETLALGLRRLQGVSRAAYSRRFGTRPEADFAPELRALRRLGLIADRGAHLCLTERGFLFADEVFLRFVGR